VFSGEDFAIIRECSLRIQIFFSLIGLFVTFILGSCFLSALYFTEHLFHNLFLDVTVGLVWGFIVTNLYVLLLYTVSPTLLPFKFRRNKSRKTALPDFNMAMVLRILMVALLAIITAQPLNIFIFKPDSVAFAQDIKLLLTESYYPWVITFVVLIIFILPIYLKYSIRNFGQFYIKKTALETRIILEDYQGLKSTFKEILDQEIQEHNRSIWRRITPLLEKLKQVDAESYKFHQSEIVNELNNENIQKYEYWADPPFRTLNKANSRIYRTEKELLNEIYSDKS